jgi:hypothetical protein
MRTKDDIWLPEQDTWGADRLAWEDDEDARDDHEHEDPALEDPRY